jgi:threonine/homoserine/homoserine lactone efflux protein
MCLPWMALGWLATQLPREWALFLIALCTSLLAWIGGALISYFGFGTFRAQVDETRKRDR